MANDNSQLTNDKWKIKVPASLRLTIQFSFDRGYSDLPEGA